MGTRHPELRAAKAEIERLAEILGIPRPKLPLYSAEPGPDLTAVNSDASRFYLDYNDNGKELVRDSFDSLDGLLYELFRRLTFSMASDWELANRAPKKDSRHLLFKRHQELMAQLSQEWLARLHADHANILERHPFDDRLAERSDRWQELISQGHSRAEAVKQAEREIP